jgi:hypothetical protein
LSIQQRFTSIKKTIDAELLRSIITNSGLVRRMEEEEITDDTIFELSKKILKDMLTGSSIIRRNRDGFSVSYTSDKIEELASFRREANSLMREFRGTEVGAELTEFINGIDSPFLSNEHNYFARNRNFQFNTDDGKLLFYVRFSNYNQYRFYTYNFVFHCVFELVHLVEEFERKVEELSRFNRLQEEIRERLEAQRREEERRQRLMNQGFSREGVSLGDRLQEILNRRGGSI